MMNSGEVSVPQVHMSTSTTVHHTAMREKNTVQSIISHSCEFRSILK